MGVDSKHDGLNNNAAFNGDTIMLITFNPKTLQVTMFSIPRDTFVPIACNNNKAYKINSAAAYGTACMVNTVQNLTGITIDYYLKINFKGVVKLVDVIGGITVDVPKPDFQSEYCLEDSNRTPKAVCLKPGSQNLDGEHALALARVRKAFVLGDFKRVQNQQLVLEAMANKIKSIRNVDMFYKILNTISHNLDSNLSIKQMLNLYNVGKNILSNKNLNTNFIDIQKTYLTGYDLNIYLNSTNTYTFQYYKESLNEIISAMKINLEIMKPELIKSFKFSVKKHYETHIIGKIYPSEPRKEVLPNFVGQSIQYFNNWNHTRNINFKINYNNSDTSCMNDLILSQNTHSGVLILTINNLEFTVCKNETVFNYTKPNINTTSTTKPIDENIIDELLN